jgi:transposase
MLHIEFTESDIQALREARYTHPHPRVMSKIEALYLKSKGLTNQQICQIEGICSNTLLEYFRQYMAGGVERLKEIRFYRPGSDLKEYSGTIEKYFTENPPSSISQASAKIEELTGIKRGETQVRKFLKSLNFRFMKVAPVPAKAMDESKKTNNVNSWNKSSNLD